MTRMAVASARPGDPLAAGQAIVRAVDATIAVPAHRTRDLGGPLGTKAFTARVIAAMDQ